MFEVEDLKTIRFDGGASDGECRRVIRLPRTLTVGSEVYYLVGREGWYPDRVYIYRTGTPGSIWASRHRLFLEQLRLEAVSRHSESRFIRARELVAKMKRQGRTGGLEYKAAIAESERLSELNNEAAKDAYYGPRYVAMFGRSVADEVAYLMSKAGFAEPGSAKCGYCFEFVNVADLQDGRCRRCR